MDKQIIFNGKEDQYQIWKLKFHANMDLISKKKDLTSKADINQQKWASLLLSIPDNLIAAIITQCAANDADAALEFLEKKFASNSPIRQSKLIFELFSIKFENLENFQAIIQNNLFALAATGFKLDPLIIWNLVLQKLPGKYNSIVTNMIGNPKNISLTALFTEIEQVTLLTDMKEPLLPTPTIFLTETAIFKEGYGYLGDKNRKKPGKSVICNFCKKTASHYDEDCYQNPNHPKYKPNLTHIKPKQHKNTHTSHSHLTSGYNTEGQDEDDEHYLHAQAFLADTRPKVSKTNIPHNHTFKLYVDSCATHHFIDRQELFSTYTPFLPNQGIYYTSNTPGRALGYGNVTLDNGITLTQCYHTPGISKCLMSIPRFIEAGHSITLSKLESKLIFADINTPPITLNTKNLLPFFNTSIRITPA